MRPNLDILAKIPGRREANRICHSAVIRKSDQIASRCLFVPTFNANVVRAYLLVSSAVQLHVLHLHIDA